MPSGNPGIPRGPRPAGWINPNAGRKLSPELRAKLRAARLANLPPLAVRFWAKVEKTDGCWIWRGAKRTTGYGHLSVDNKHLQAHRVGFELQTGKPIPPGMVLDHLCKNPLCVRADHLRVVTARVNALENNDSPFAKLASLTHCPKCGNEYAGKNLALYTPPRRKTRHGRPTTPTPQRKCLTCYPTYWRYCVVAIDPPPGARNFKSRPPPSSNSSEPK